MLLRDVSRTDQTGMKRVTVYSLTAMSLLRLSCLHVLLSILTNTLHHIVKMVQMTHNEKYIDMDGSFQGPYMSRGIITSDNKHPINTLVLSNHIYEDCSYLVTRWRYTYDVYVTYVRDKVRVALTTPH